MAPNTQLGGAGATPSVTSATLSGTSATPTDTITPLGDSGSDSDDSDFDPEAPPPDEALSSDDDDPAEKTVPQYTQFAPGGLVKTRTQRAQEATESKFANVGRKHHTGLDVDSIFSDMKKMSSEGRSFAVAAADVEPTSKQILIERTYEFAGRLVKENKMVDANSAEAKAYLNSNKLKYESKAAESKPSLVLEEIEEIKLTKTGLPLRRPLKRVSLIDSILKNPKAVKLSTLEKSRLDWAVYVDHNKISGELEVQGRDGYLEKQAFLNKVEVSQHEQKVKVARAERAAHKA